MVSVMQELSLQMVYRHHKNVGRVEICRSPPSFREEFAEKTLRSLILVASLQFHQAQTNVLCSPVEIRSLLSSWCNHVADHERDWPSKGGIGSCRSGGRIVPRILQVERVSESCRRNDPPGEKDP
jgi:hypothetical protein